MKKILLLIILIFIFSGCSNKKDDSVFNEEKVVNDNESIEENSALVINTNEDKKNAYLPKEVFLEVPFTSQAPYAFWNEKHKEACEEASLVMLAYFLKNKQISVDLAEKEIQNLITFQKKNYGKFEDSNAWEITVLAKDYYKINNLRVLYDFDKEEIKKQLAKGNPIIVPVAGRELGNPFFTQPGPLYHSLILTGYKEDKIISNDPGTKRGENYEYDLDVLYMAIHDFTGDKKSIEQGRKAMIVVAND